MKIHLRFFDRINNNYSLIPSYNGRPTNRDARIKSHYIAINP
jgi:hypothetical protein